MAEPEPDAARPPAPADTGHPSFAGLSESALRRLRLYLSGRLQPVAARLASTMVLLREGSAGTEVLLLRRAGSMRFAPGMYVFPGGVVDPADAAGPIVAASDETARSGISSEDERMLVTAAVRETFEECAVLLAGTSSRRLAVPDETWASARAAIESRTETFTGFLERRGLTVRADLVHPWSRWVTPMWSPRRFDTYFWIARLPEHRQIEAINDESDRMVWRTPAQALREHRAGTLPMLLPTASTLAELASGTHRSGTANHDLVRMVRPLDDEDGLRLVIDTERGPVDKDRYLTHLLGG